MLMGNGQYFPFLSLLGEWRTGVLENQYSSFTSYWDNRKFVRFGFLWCSVSVCLCVSVFVWCESRANSMKRRKEYTHEWWNLIRSGVKPKEWQWNERSAIEMGIILIWQTSAYIDEDAMNVPELFVGNCNDGTEREKVFIHGYIFFCCFHTQCSVRTYAPNHWYSATSLSIAVILVCSSPRVHVFRIGSWQHSIHLDYH